MSVDRSACCPSSLRSVRRVHSDGIPPDEVVEADRWNVLGGEGPDPPVARGATLTERRVAVMEEPDPDERRRSGREWVTTKEAERCRIALEKAKEEAQEPFPA